MKESVATGRSAPDPYGTIPRAAPEPETLDISPPAAIPTDVRDTIFGRLALLLGLVDQETLDKARSEQSTCPAKSLAELLIEMGKLAIAERQALEVLLARHLSRLKEHPQASISSLVSFSNQVNAPAPLANTISFISAVSDSHLPRRMFGHYELLSEIARGGMGVVYKARQTKLNRLVALKMIRSGELADEEQVRRFYVEAEAAAILDHPGIVPVYEVGEIDGQHFFSMAFIQGQSLNDRVKADGPLPPKLAAKLMQAVANAVQFAHDKGIVHRDIKPHNILLDKNEQPRVADFGLAKQVQGGSEMTTTGQVLGTPSYMPPEQAAGKSDEVGKAADVYSLGATLYCLLTGRPPFQASSLAETIRQVIDVQPVPLRRLNPEIPRDLETICLKCLRKEPEKRYARARELAEDLGCWLDNKPITARPVGPAERTWLWCKRRPALVGLSLVFLVLSIFGTLIGTFLAIERQNATRAVALVDALMDAPPEGVPSVIENLKSVRWHALPVLRQRFVEESRDVSQRIHLAYALADFGETDVTFLVSAVGAAQPAECANFTVALDHARESAVVALHTQSQSAETAKDFPQKARLAIVAMYLEDFTVAADMLNIAERPDPVQRTLWIHEFTTWHGDVAKLPNLVAKNQDGALRSGVALGLGGVSDPDEGSKALWKQLLSDWYVRQPDSVTHSAAGWAMRQWNLPEPKLESSDQPKPGIDWMATKGGLTLVRIPAGKFVRSDEDYPPPTTQEVTLTRDFWLSDREVSVAQFRAFMNDATYAGLKPEKWEGEEKKNSPTPQHPVQQVNWYDAVMYCNWLSARESRTPFYELTGEKEKIEGRGEFPKWRLKTGGTGYRLPTEAEWEYACRAGTTTAFSSGEDEKLLAGYAVLQASKTDLPGSRRCNGWGLFDIHGNVWEWCADWYAEFGNEVAINDPIGPATGTSRVLRGGSFNFFARVVRSGYRIENQPAERYYSNGFRVARTCP